MHAFCTCCSSRKNHAQGNLPALQRYQSERIDRVHAAALDRQVGFLILSGQYGLIPPDHPIPYYDHLLTADEVTDRTPLVVEQLAAHDISRLEYFTRPLASDGRLRPYRDLLMAACAEREVDLRCIEIDATGGRVDGTTPTGGD